MGQHPLSAVPPLSAGAFTGTVVQLHLRSRCAGRMQDLAEIPAKGSVSPQNPVRTSRGRRCEDPSRADQYHHDP
jgi:hypothetical protein